MLRAGVDYRNLHGSGAEKGTYSVKLVVAYPLHVVHGPVDGVNPLVAGRVPALAVSHQVEHHEPLLGYGRLHARRLAHDGHADGRQ